MSGLHDEGQSVQLRGRPGWGWLSRLVGPALVEASVCVFGAFLVHRITWAISILSVNKGRRVEIYKINDCPLGSSHEERWMPATI
ncbi:hypothetical protein Bra471DRAFT_02221 [Bradyrhizobium sp. WSM471]|jgi:hypothetical protein|nr:hypothetical protein Bra471DRAFT_02221 [Bradyrhizobium sp. WSM471]